MRQRMCLAVPGKLIEIEGYEGKCAVGGATISARLNLVDEVQVGDYVLVHAGFAITKLEEAEALETLALLREVGRVG